VRGCVTPGQKVNPRQSIKTHHQRLRTTWYFQFFFYTMGETQMGRFKFSSWTLHMASIIIFSTLWGIALKEWKGAGSRTKFLVALSLLALVGSTMIVGYGNYIGTAGRAAQSASSQ